jgi:hypothetical protein
MSKQIIINLKDVDVELIKKDFFENSHGILSGFIEEYPYEVEDAWQAWKLFNDELVDNWNSYSEQITTKNGIEPKYKIVK